MRADPPLRRDGRCAQCGGERKARPNRYSGLAAQLDPFCSTACCKAYHGVEEAPGRTLKPKRAYV